MVPVSQPVKKPAGKVMPLLLIFLFFALVVSSCVGKYAWTASAPPLARTVALVEGDARVSGALGGPVSVSLVVTKTLRRDLLLALQGRDMPSLLTKVKGSKGEGWLRVSAQNYDGQGWAGTFSLTMEGRQVLEGGSYKSEGAATLLEGDFAADGTPRITKK
jgi:hypothetical protein